MKVFTTNEFAAVLRAEEYGQPQLTLINRWLDRGDGAAVYQNVDLGHAELGHVKIVSFGSAAAQLEVTEVADLPDRLPDGLPSGAINWRYSLQGTYRGRTLSVAEVA